jgi:hypothetical protein
VVDSGQRQESCSASGTMAERSHPSRANSMVQYPESRVLIIMTGGTICMKISPEGLVPARGFLEQGMAPRPSFNDGSAPGEFYDSLAVCEHTLRFVVCVSLFSGWAEMMRVKRGSWRTIRLDF